MRSLFGSVVMVALFVLVGCDAPPQPKSTIQGTDTGRKETKSLIAAEAVGYDGQQVRASVDRVLDLNDQRNQELEKMTQPAGK